MATSERGAEAESIWFTGVGRVALVAAVAGVDTVALVAWLSVVGDSPAASRAAAPGLGILLAGLVVEHVLTAHAVNGSDRSVPASWIVASSASEAAVWTLWLAVAQRVGGLQGLLAAGGMLAFLLVFQHTIEDNVLRGRGPVSVVFDLAALWFSLVEAAGATVWLLAVTRPGRLESVLVDLGLAGVDPPVLGVGVLVGALLLAHVLGVGFFRRTREWAGASG